MTGPKNMTSQASYLSMVFISGMPEPMACGARMWTTPVLKLQYNIWSHHGLVTLLSGYNIQVVT